MPKRQQYRGDLNHRVLTVDSPFVPMHTCPACGKQAYTSRKDAKYMGKRLHQGKKIRVHTCRYERESQWNNQEHWHVTTMGAWATMRFKDYNASGGKPYAEYKED